MQNKPAYITLYISITVRSQNRLDVEGAMLWCVLRGAAILAVNGVSMGGKLSQWLIYIVQKDKQPGNLVFFLPNQVI